MSDIVPPQGLRWFVAVDSKVYGPYDAAAISQMSQRGQIQATDLVLREGTSDWLESAKDPLLGTCFTKGRAASHNQPPIRRRQRRWIGKLVTTGLVLLALGWIAWPYYAVLSLLQAVHDGDASTLERRVDWNSVRQSLRGDLNAQLLQKVRDKNNSKDDAMAAGFATLLGPAIINQMIDSYVTPQAIAALRRSEGSAPGADDRLAKIDQSFALARKIQWDQVQYAFFAKSPFAFKVDILLPNDPPLRHPIGLEFGWSGDWRLVHIALPEDLIDSNDRAPSRPTANSVLTQATKQASSAAESQRNDEPALIEVFLRSKRFKTADYKADDFEAAIIFELSIANRSEKAIRAFDGTLTFTDLLDNKVFSSRLAINDPIAVGSTMNWTGRIKYNQFMDDHNALKNENFSNLKTKFKLRKVLFADGSTKEL